MANLSDAPLTLGQLMEAVPEIKTATPQLIPAPNLIGKKFTIAGQTYEWHYFLFTGSKKDLPKKITFADYISNHSLHKLKSLAFHPIDGFTLECFDTSRTHTGDEAYFNIVLRRVDDGEEEWNII